MLKYAVRKGSKPCLNSASVNVKAFALIVHKARGVDDDINAGKVREREDSSSASKINVLAEPPAARMLLATCSSLAWSRAAKYTSAPSRARACATALPMAPLPPKMTAVLF
jgi:hypothetical protein